ncbi:hypothetical protein BH09MYX1_BH09MYX1_40670 [soil metagenome]
MILTGFADPDQPKNENGDEAPKSERCAKWSVPPAAIAGLHDDVDASFDPGAIALRPPRTP